MEISWLSSKFRMFKRGCFVSLKLFSFQGLTILLILIFQVFANKTDTKVVKDKNALTLKCLLSDKHEKFNKMSKARWYWKTQNWWEEIKCENCGVTLNLTDDDIELSTMIMCKLSPYQISSNQTLQIEISRTFHLDHAKGS